MSTVNAGEAIVYLDADTVEYGDSLKQAQAMMSRYGVQVTSTAAKASKAMLGSFQSTFRRIGESLFSLRSLVAGGLASLGATALVGNWVELSRQIETTSIKIGDTIDQTSRLMYVANRSRVSGEEYIKAISVIGTATRQMTGTSADAIRRLGIDLESLKTKSPVNQLVEVADAISRIADASRKTQALSDVFGGELGIKIKPLIEGGLGGKISSAAGQGNASVKAGVAFGNATTEIKAAFQTLIGSIMSSIGPTLTRWIEIGTNVVRWVTNIASKYPGIVSTGIKIATGIATVSAAMLTVNKAAPIIVNHLGMISSSYSWLSRIFTLLSSWFSWEKAKTFLNIDITRFFAKKGGSIPVARATALGFTPQTNLSGIATKSTGAINTTVMSIRGLFSSIGPNLMKLGPMLKNLFVGAFSAGAPGIGAVIAAIVTTYLSPAIFSSLAKGGSAVFSALWEGRIFDAIKGILATIGLIGVRIAMSLQPIWQFFFSIGKTIWEAVAPILYAVGAFVFDYVIKPINSYVIQPFINYIIKPLWEWVKYFGGMLGKLYRYVVGGDEDEAKNTLKDTEKWLVDYLDNIKGGGFRKESAGAVEDAADELTKGGIDLQNAASAIEKTGKDYAQESIDQKIAQSRERFYRREAEKLQRQQEESILSRTGNLTEEERKRKEGLEQFYIDARNAAEFDRDITPNAVAANALSEIDKKVADFYTRQAEQMSKSQAKDYESKVLNGENVKHFGDLLEKAKEWFGMDSDQYRKAQEELEKARRQKEGLEAMNQSVLMFEQQREDFRKRYVASHPFLSMQTGGGKIVSAAGSGRSGFGFQAGDVFKDMDKKLELIVEATEATAKNVEGWEFEAKLK